MKKKYSKKTLFFHLLFFRDLDEKTKLDIFKASSRNDFRLLKKQSYNQKKIRKNIIEAQRIKDITVYNQILKKIYIKFSDNINDKNYINKIIEIENFLKSHHFNALESGLILNLYLVHEGLCPFLRFSFNKWKNITKKNAPLLIPDLAEFSTAYLYRLASIKNKTVSKKIPFAIGSHNFLFKENNILKKIPKSIAAKLFINDQEIKTTRLLINSSLKKYIPNLINYDKETKIITKQYISGLTGHSLLKTNFFNSNNLAIKDLRNFFLTYKKFNKEFKIILDIHPGNFVWSEDRMQWFLIDAGPIPFIGSEYFPLNSFKKYFDKIWLERLKRIKTVPIRSVDLYL